MAGADTIVISASRRTDIPAFYMDWFMDRIEKKSFRVTNPYNRVTRTIPAGPDAVHSIVFWSKNYGPFLDMGAGSRLKDLGYHLYFQFTVNSESPLLEPGIPRLKNRLDQMERLCRLFGPATVSWRFDPVCFYETPDGPGNNLSDFITIARAASGMGIRSCVTSFVDTYRKIRKRLSALTDAGKPSLTLVDPVLEKKTDIIRRMEKQLASLNIHLSTCCEKDLLDQLPQESCVTANACISGAELRKLFGGRPILARDYGQRSGQGCRCTRAVDVGDYTLHPCFHDCLFCYANPSMDVTPLKGKIR